MATLPAHWQYDEDFWRMVMETFPADSSAGTLLKDLAARAAAVEDAFESERKEWARCRKEWPARFDKLVADRKILDAVHDREMAGMKADMADMKGMAERLEKLHEENNMLKAENKALKAASATAVTGSS